MDGQHHIADVLQTAQPPQAAHVIELPALGIEPAPGVVVIGAQRGLHLLHREPDPGQPGRVEQRLVLHLAAAESGIVGHAPHLAELRLHHPVLEGLQLHGRAVGALQHVAVDQARGRREGRH